MMVFENFSDFISQFSLENFVRGDFTGVSEVFYLVVSMAIYSIFVWHFYRFIARRDCFKISMKKHPRVIGFLSYAFMYPIIAFLFFLGFSLPSNILHTCPAPGAPSPQGDEHPQGTRTRIDS